MRINSVELFLNLDQWFRRRCCLRFLTYEFWRSSCSAEQNHLCNFGRGHYGEHSCVITLGPVVQEEMLFQEKVYGRRTMDDAQQTKTEHNSSPHHRLR